jgi:uncharacterized phage protein (TIGR02218 family)/uncharacterized protein (TIGR02217 family)
MTDIRLEIDESYGTVANYSYKTDVITLGDGTEQRNINWRYPLTRFNLSKVFFCQNLLDYLIDFHDDMKGRLNQFRFRDYNDFSATNQPFPSGLSTSTQGVLLPIPDGIRTEFQLCKKYSLESNSVYRIITRPDITQFEVFINGITEIVTIFPSSGKVVFLTPPPVGSLLTWEGTFDIPVRFEQDKINYKLISSDGIDNIYTLDELSLVEVREQSKISNPRGTFIQEINHEFALDFYTESIISPSFQTLVNTIDNQWDRRDGQWNIAKAEYKFSERYLCTKEIEYLLTLFRICRGAGIGFKYRDHSGYKSESQPLNVRFSEDTLSIKFNAYDGEDKIYSVSGFDLKEIHPAISNVGIFGKTVNPIARIWKLISNKQYYEICWSVNGVKTCLQNINPIASPDIGLIPWAITWDIENQHIINNPNNYSWEFVPNKPFTVGYRHYTNFDNPNDLPISYATISSYSGDFVGFERLVIKGNPSGDFCANSDNGTDQWLVFNSTAGMQSVIATIGSGPVVSWACYQIVSVVPTDGLWKLKIVDDGIIYHYSIDDLDSVEIIYKSKLRLTDSVTGQVLLEEIYDSTPIIEPNSLTLGFTNHDIDINFSGLIYQGEAGFSPTAITVNNEGAVNNSDINSILSSDGITELDITGGKWENAKLIIYLINWFTNENYVLFNGRLGETETSDRTYKAEARGLTQYLQQGRVRQTSAICHLKFGEFGDNKCNKSLVGLIDNYVIISVINSRQFTVISARPNGFFNQGTVYFTTGLNIGNTSDVLSFDGVTIILWEGMGFPIQVGDEITVTAGCLKTLDACESYGNAQNFGGTPFIPGADAYLKNI